MISKIKYRNEKLFFIFSLCIFIISINILIFIKNLLETKYLFLIVIFTLFTFVAFLFINYKNDKKDIKPLEGWFIFLISVNISILSSTILKFIYKYKLFGLSKIPYSLMYYLFCWIILFIVLLFLIKFKNLSFRKIFKLNNTFKIPNYIYFILLPISFNAFGLFIITPLEMHFLDINIVEYTRNTQFNFIVRDFFDVITIFSFLILAPSIIEEFIFRGYIQHCFSTKLKPILVIVFTSLLFGIFHLNIVTGIFTFFAGLLFSYITYKSKSIYPSMIVHFFQNLSVAICVNIIINLEISKIGNKLMIFDLQIHIVGGIISVFLFIFSIVGSLRVLKQVKSKVLINE